MKHSLIILTPLLLALCFHLRPSFGGQAGNVPAANIVLQRDGKPAAEYHAECTPFKPYVAQLYSPSGVGVLRDNVADTFNLIECAQKGTKNTWSPMDLAFRTQTVLQMAMMAWREGVVARFDARSRRILT